MRRGRRRLDRLRRLARGVLRPFAGGVGPIVGKAALHALAEVVAIEERGHGIRANVVVPRVIDTPANRPATTAPTPRLDAAGAHRRRGRLAPDRRGRRDHRRAASPWTGRRLMLARLLALLERDADRVASPARRWSRSASSPRCARWPTPPGSGATRCPVGDRAVLGLYHARPAHAVPFLFGAALVVLALRLRGRRAGLGRWHGRRASPGPTSGSASAGALVAVYCAATGTFGEGAALVELSTRERTFGFAEQLVGLAGVARGGAGRRAGAARAARARARCAGWRTRTRTTRERRGGRDAVDARRPSATPPATAAARGPVDAVAGSGSDPAGRPAGSRGRRRGARGAEPEPEPAEP